MGVTGLWDAISTAIERVPLSHISGKTIAVDLAWWIMADRSIAQSRFNPGSSQPTFNLHTKEMQNFHVRNLLFRAQKMIVLGAIPIFVLDGKAPDRKLQTIAARLGKTEIKSGERRQLMRLFKPCCDLFDGMGLQWIQAPFEAEKMCAILQQAGKVDAVLTQDGDSFCFGATQIYRTFSCEEDAEIEFVELSTIKEKFGFTRFDFITFALLLGCDFFPSGIKGIGPKFTQKLIAEWKKSKLHPIQRLIMIKSEKVSDLSKDEKKLSKLLGNYKDIKFEDLILEFKSSAESDLAEKIDIIEKPIITKKIINSLVTYLEWEEEKSSIKAIEYYLKSGKSVQDLKFHKILKMMKGGKNFIVDWIIGNSNHQEIKMKAGELEILYPDAFRKHQETNKPASKPKPKNKKENVEDIRKFIQLKNTDPKRKIDSPLQSSNPMPNKANKLKTPQKLTDRVQDFNFSLGMSLLCDELDNSTLEESPVISRQKKTASKIIKEKIIDTLNSPEIQTRKLTPVQLNPKVVESDSSDEEFMSLADRARLKKNCQKT